MKVILPQIKTIWFIIFCVLAVLSPVDVTLQPCRNIPELGHCVLEQSFPRSLNDVTKDLGHFRNQLASATNSRCTCPQEREVYSTKSIIHNFTPALKSFKEENNLLFSKVFYQGLLEISKFKKYDGIRCLLYLAIGITTLENMMPYQSVGHI